MKTKLLLVVTLIALLGLTISAFAGYGGEKVITTDGGLRLTGGYGPQSIEFLANGTATVKLIRITSAGFVTTYFMSSGDSLFNLRSIPRVLDVAGSQVDSLVFDLVTATEVVTTW